MRATLLVWSEGRKRLLAEILEGLHVSPVWQLKWFDGVVDSGGWCPPLDQRVDITLSDSELRALSDRLVDLNDIEVVGTLPNGESVRLVCFDSTSWSIDYPPELKQLVDGWIQELD